MGGFPVRGGGKGPRTAKLTILAVNASFSVRWTAVLAGLAAVFWRKTGVERKKTAVEVGMMGIKPIILAKSGRATGVGGCATGIGVGATGVGGGAIGVGTGATGVGGGAIGVGASATGVGRPVLAKMAANFAKIMAWTGAKARKTGVETKKTGASRRNLGKPLGMYWHLWAPELYDRQGNRK